MKFISVLHQGNSENGECKKPEFFEDLNLDQIVKRIARIWGEDIKEHYYDLPENRDEEDYRREILRDVKQGELFQNFCDFLTAMKQREKLAAMAEKVEEKKQIAFLHLQAMEIYWEAVEALRNALRQAELSSQGLLGFQNYLDEYLESEKNVSLRSQVQRLRKEQQSFRLRLVYEKDFLKLSLEEPQEPYEKFLEECFPQHGKQFVSPFLAQEELTELEVELLKLFSKKHKSFFTETERLLSNTKEYVDSVILRFQQEIPYYLGFLTFRCQMEKQGFLFATPRIDSGRRMEAKGLYDLALASLNSEQENKKEVVSNDMEYREGESFFVVTGPNQGGKTTFARCLGQLVFFSKMGLDVPAESAVLPYFTNILTHFSVEESVETGRGKLMEELTRLVPMMQEKAEGAFVIINELFTTAANYDACIMGKKVLEHFIQRDCMGIYVTHLNELSKAHEKIVSLRATLNEQQLQTYKIVRQEAQELAGAGIQVKKYRLTYEQIKERFS